MKKKIYIYLALTLCVLFQSPSYASLEYEELQSFLDDFHRINLGEWIPKFDSVCAEFENRFERCSEESTQKKERIWERFIAMAVRYYGTPEVKRILFEKVSTALGPSDLIRSTLQTINDVDESWLLTPVKGLLISKFKKEIRTGHLPHADVTPRIFADDNYDGAVEKLCIFLDDLHRENLDSGVSHPEAVRSTFSQNVENICSQFNIIFPIENEERVNELYTLKVDVCRAYTRFIPIVMQYYCSEQLTEELFEEAFSILKEIDPCLNYPQVTYLIKATKLMIDTMNSIGKVEGGFFGGIVGSARTALIGGFKKKLK